MRGPTRQGARPRGAGAPPPSWTRCGPPDVDSSSCIFNIFQKYVPWSFRSFRELLFLHINNTMESLLKTVSVRVSSIQIMQVRVENKGKSVWKSRYGGDESSPPGISSPSIFYIFQNNSPLIFMSFRELIFLHKNNTMAIMLKKTSVQVSSI